MQRFQTRLALGLSLLLAGLPAWSAGAATLSPVAGTVTIDGHAIVGAATLAPGSVVRVGEQGTARLTIVGSSVLAAAKTAFQWEDSGKTSQLRLTFGELDVRGTLPVALRSYTVAPRSTARFQVTALQHMNYLHVVSGAVSLRASGRSEIVPAGATVSFDDTPPQASAPAAAGGGLSGLATAGIVSGLLIAGGIVIHAATACSSCVVTATQP